MTGKAVVGAHSVGGGRCGVLQLGAAVDVPQKFALLIPRGLHLAWTEKLLRLVPIERRVRPVALPYGSLGPALDRSREHHHLRRCLPRLAPTRVIRSFGTESDGARRCHSFVLQGAS